MPPNVLNILTPVIDYKDSVERVDYRESVFVFLSNTGSKLITERYMELWRDGVRREDMELKHFENVISKGTFNEEGSSETHVSWAFVTVYVVQGDSTIRTRSRAT